MRVLAITSLLALGCFGTLAEIVDSVVAIVGTRAIKHSDVLKEIRLVSLLNHEPVDLGTKPQQEAASRLIDQAIIQDEIEAGMFVPDNPDEAKALLDQLRDSYGGPEDFRKALAAHQVDEESLKERLRWETAVLRFIELRFGQSPSSADGEPKNTSSNDAFFQWLDGKRQEKHVVLRKERLE